MISIYCHFLSNNSVSVYIQSGAVYQFCRSCFGKFPQPNGRSCRYPLPKQTLAIQTEKTNKI